MITESLVFWGGTAYTSSFEERCEAAVAGGFTDITVFPYDCRPPFETDAGRVRAIADRHGLRIAVLDAFAAWVPVWAPPPDMAPDLIERIGTPEDEIFAMADTLGAETILMFEVFGIAYPLEALVAAFGRICDRAAAAGKRAALEFTPFGSVPDLASAWAIVSAADRPNGGLLLDTWHYFRGRPDGGLLDRIPGDRIFHVQANDGPTQPVVPSLREEQKHFRLLPGDGDWDVAGVLGVLQRKSGIGQFGVETFNDELIKEPPVEIGRRAGDALRRVLAASG